MRKAPPTTLALLAAFERVVVDTPQAKFVRTFAWCRCVRACTAMHHHDHRGRYPKLMRLCPPGLRGTLVGAKTAGAGKRREQLEVVVDRSAFTAEPTWLEVGWGLWSGLFPARDFCLGRPSTDLQSMRCIEACVADFAAMGHVLTQGLVDESGTKLFVSLAATKFGLEHSVRPFLILTGRLDTRH